MREKPDGKNSGKPSAPPEKPRRLFSLHARDCYIRQRNHVMAFRGLAFGSHPAWSGSKKDTANLLTLRGF